MAAKAPKPNLRLAALYLRVSTEDQAERGTIENQRDVLRKAALSEYTIAGIYEDDGISGSIPMELRPNGRRLLEDAAAGKFGTVLVYKLDRFSRDLRLTLNVKHQLDGLGIKLKSVSENLDTSTASGRMQFQILGSFGQFEKEQITERMVGGRDKAARDGKWVAGPIPFGYTLDANGYLTPSDREVAGTGLSESEIAASVFRNVAAGSSTVAECRRLNALRVPTVRRYGGGREVTVGDSWLPSRINNMLKSTTYRGIHTFAAQSGPIERPVPALVDEVTWHKANTQLEKNKAGATRERKRDYLLRGLVTCGSCGAKLVGTASKDRRTGWEARYYRCGSQLGSLHPEAHDRCRSKNIAAEWLEGKVWSDIKDFLLNPGDALAEAQEQAKSLQFDTDRLSRERAGLIEAIAGKEKERDVILRLARQESISYEVARDQLEQITQETETLKESLSDIESELRRSAVEGSSFEDAEKFLALLAGRVDKIEAMDNFEKKRELIEALVVGITIITEGEGYGKTARAHFRYAFGPLDYVADTPNRKTGDKSCIVQIARESTIPKRIRLA